jgi:hypothetical protein
LSIASNALGTTPDASGPASPQRPTLGTTLGAPAPPVTPGTTPLLPLPPLPPPPPPLRSEAVVTLTSAALVAPSAVPARAALAPQLLLLLLLLLLAAAGCPLEAPMSAAATPLSPTTAPTSLTPTRMRFASASPPLGVS